MRRRTLSRSILALAWFAAGALDFARAQGPAPGAERQASAQLELRKTAQTREYQGQAVEGEQWVVRPGETLWRVLIDEKGLSEKRFGQYQSIIQGLNPHLQELNLLRAGDAVFIPFRLDELLGIASPSPGTGIYRVKPGDFVYRILQRELALERKEEIQAAFEKLKQLNPAKKNWNLLLVGETLRLPGAAPAPPTVVSTPAREPPPSTTPAPREEPVRVAEFNWSLIEQIAAVLGGTFLRSGEEVFQLPHGKVTLDRALFPVLVDTQLGRRVIIDARDAIPAAMKARIEAEAADTSVVTVKKESGAPEVGRQLLTRLGYQALPANRPLVLHDMGVGIQLKGDWMAMQPEANGVREQIWVFVLTKAAETMPDALRSYLSARGVKLAQIVTPVAVNAPAPAYSLPSATGATENLPAERTGLVDGLLQSGQIPFAREREVGLLLQEGIHLRIRVDRYWESDGKKIGLLFGRLAGEVKKAVEASADLKLVEVDIKNVTTREIVERVLQAMGEAVTYAENRIARADGGRLSESLVFVVRGFLARERSLLITDRSIPPDVERFILNQGIKIAYFR